VILLGRLITPVWLFHTTSGLLRPLARLAPLTRRLQAARLVPGTHGPAHHVGADLVAGIRIIARGGNGTTS
jgi:hypothetical protein